MTQTIHSDILVGHDALAVGLPGQAMPRFHSTHHLFFLVCLLLAALGCQGLPASPIPWTIENLRKLDPLDAPMPAVEILALYTRTLGSDLEIRLDLLDLPLTPDYDLVFELQTPAEEITIRVPADGRPTVISRTPGLRVRIVRDPWLDTITLVINRLYVLQPFSVQASSHFHGQALPVDEIGFVRSDALPPLQRAPVVIAFWDGFPATTPAQALRFWDGAHTGPEGGRHGLKNLLDSVEEYALPVVLLDLMTPASLAALDFVGALPQVQRLTVENLLILPEAAYSQPADAALAFSRQAASGFGLPGSLFVYASGGEPQPGYRYQFLSIPDPSHLASSGRTKFIPLSATTDMQITTDGPALSIRRLLVNTVLSADPSDLLTLGGSLPDSNWGDFDMAAPAFAWLASHPWIQVLGKEDLMTFPVGNEMAPSASLPNGQDTWLTALRQAPDGEVTQTAWRTYLMLHAPTGDAALRSLREAYGGQVGILLGAAAWAGSPSIISDCSTDLDLDGGTECLLADLHYYAVIEPSGARLTHLFFLDDRGIHQLVAPTSQFSVGLSDPSQWHPELGEAADPGAVMGAFSDTNGTFDEYSATLTGRLLRLARPGITKTFQLTETGLEFTCQALDEIKLFLPLAVDSPAFYTGPSNFQAVLTPSSWSWGTLDGVMAEVRTDAEISAQGFSVSQAFMARPEDPNQDYPAGHYLPFPLSLVTVRGEGELMIWIEGK